MTLATLAFAVLYCYLQPPSTHYALLGITPTATSEEIKKAFRKQSLKYHPDRNPGATKWAQEQFVRLSEAYETLMDPEEREAYDARLREKTSAGKSRRQSYYKGQYSQSRAKTLYYTGHWWTLGAIWERMTPKNLAKAMLSLGLCTFALNDFVPMLWNFLSACVGGPPKPLSTEERRQMRDRLRAVRQRQQEKLVGSRAPIRRKCGALRRSPAVVRGEGGS